MNEIYAGLIAGLSLLVLISLRIPIGLGLALVGGVGTWIITGRFSTVLKLLTTTPFYSIDTFSLVVVPLFILMGIFSLHGGISDGAFAAARNWFGRIPGSLMVATIWACVGFGAASGSSIATSSIFTQVTLPEMKRAGYNLNYCCACIATAGIIAMLIPPSILMVFCAIFTEQSVAKLLIAGVGPGIVLAICLTAGVLIQSWRNPTLAPSDTTVITWREKLRSIAGLWAISVMILIILGGIWSGVFSPSEAAAIGCSAAFVLAFINGKVSWEFVRNSAVETARFSGVLFIILIGANIFARFLTLSGFANALGDKIMSIGLSGMGLVLLMMVIYLLLGCFLDSVSSMALTLPVIYRPLIDLGVNPIWFGVLTVFCLNLGKITPPMGMDVFAVKAAAGKDVSLEGIFASCIPFIIMSLVALGLCILFPSFILFLPSKMS